MKTSSEWLLAAAISLGVVLAVLFIAVAGIVGVGIAIWCFNVGWDAANGEQQPARRREPPKVWIIRVN